MFDQFRTLHELVNTREIELGRGQIISQIDIEATPGFYPVYSSSAQGTGEFGRYGKFMFDQELITWSVDGGGRPFYRPKHKFSVTNVSGFLKIIAPQKWNYRYIHAAMVLQHASTNFDYQIKAHPSVIQYLYKFPVVPLSEQSRIAAILDTVDEAIAKTEAVIAKLKQVRAGLLHDLLTRGLDENGQLRDPIAHPEQFQDSPIGRIPKEWDVLPLGSIASVDRGKFAHRPRNDPAFYGGRFPFIQTGDIALAAGEIITEASQSLNNRGVSVSREFSEGTIAVTIAANIGDTAILGRPMFFPDSIVGVVPIPMHINRWIELTLRDAKKRLNALAPQSAQKNINLEFLRPLLVPVPSSGEQKLCVQVYENITASISTEHHVLVKLSFLKSALMADLLTGRVRVPADIFQEHS